MKLSMLICAFIILAGCTDNGLKMTCTKSHSELLLIPQFNPIDGSVGLHQTWNNVCDKWEEVK